MSDKFEKWFESELDGAAKLKDFDWIHTAVLNKHRYLSGWNAALSSLQGEVAIPWMTNGLLVVTFNDFVEYGRKSCGNAVNGMPWSFSFDGIPVTHETDTCYLLCRHPNDLRLTPDTVLIKFADGSYDVQDKTTIFKDYQFLRHVGSYPPDSAAKIAELESELAEQSRLLGISAERELDLQAKLAEVEKDAIMWRSVSFHIEEAIRNGMCNFEIEDAYERAIQESKKGDVLIARPNMEDL